MGGWAGGMKVVTVQQRPMQDGGGCLATKLEAETTPAMVAAAKKILKDLNCIYE